MESCSTRYHSFIRNSYLTSSIYKLNVNGIANLLVIIFIATSFRELISSLLESGLAIRQVVPKLFKELFQVNVYFVTGLGLILTSMLAVFLLEYTINIVFYKRNKSCIDVIKSTYSKKLKNSDNSSNTANCKHSIKTVNDMFSLYKITKFEALYWIFNFTLYLSTLIAINQAVKYGPFRPLQNLFLLMTASIIVLKEFSYAQILTETQVLSKLQNSLEYILV